MRVDLRGIHRVAKVLADGRRASYFYAWRGGPRLEGQPGSPEFIASFTRAHNERKKPPAGLLFTLIAEFRNSAEYRRLSPATRREYSRYLSIIEREFGDVPLKAIDDPRIRGDFMQWRDTMADTPRKADFAWSVLARVLSFAKDRGRIRVNPCERGGRLSRADRVDRIWTDELIDRALNGLPQWLRAAFVLALWTGQRQGDLLRLTWSQCDGEALRFHQSKTGRRLVIPLSEILREELARIPRVSPTILTNSNRKPWTSDGFRASWARAVRALGIEGLTFHDLRGSAVTRLAEAGCSEAEIAAITGHSLRDVAAMLDKHYLSRTNRLAEAAVTRLDRADRERKL